MRGQRIDWGARLTRWQRIRRWWREWEVEVYQLDNRTPRENAAVRVGLCNWQDQTYTHLDLSPAQWRDLLPTMRCEELRNMLRPHGPEDVRLSVAGRSGVLTERFTVPAWHLSEVIDLLEEVLCAVSDCEEVVSAFGRRRPRRSVHLA